jgi:transcriptional regulator GlxA family with amidase domain
MQTIAYDHGFTDPAMFSRTFRVECGYSPREAKEAAAAGKAHVRNGHSSMADLLRAAL